jgi:hypothetical protein
MASTIHDGLNCTINTWKNKVLITVLTTSVLVQPEHRVMTIAAITIPMTRGNDPMSNHDMSDTACIERAELVRRLEEVYTNMKALADTCEDLLKHDRLLKKMILVNKESIDLNRTAIKLLTEEILKCLKQE